MGITIERSESDRPIKMDEGVARVIVPEVDLGTLDMCSGVIGFEREHAVKMSHSGFFIAAFDRIAARAQVSLRVVGIVCEKGVVSESGVGFAVRPIKLFRNSAEGVEVARVPF